jgi:hypothetical protein
MRPSLVPQESWRDQKEIPSQCFQKSDERISVPAASQPPGLTPAILIDAFQMILATKAA